MNHVLPSDSRDKLWSELEKDIQKRTARKDKRFLLSGKWKRFLRKQEGFSIYAVDGEWIRNNLSVIFGHGGHGYVHEFIPLNEVWISTHHFEHCGCLKVKKQQKCSKAFFESTIIHEITEFREMKKGKTYWEAHYLALKKEREAGLLKNPYREIE